MVRYFMFLSWVCAVLLACVSGCSAPGKLEPSTSNTDGLKIDPATGVPYAPVFQFPIVDFDTSDFGFGFGGENDAFCLTSSGGQCTSYGYHLARDTVVGRTPVGTEVVAPADGIVRLTTDKTYGGYGSDTKSNPNYQGCVVVLEHEFPNGQAVTTLLGHVKCESGTPYDADQKAGNPPVGTIVHRGQYVAHVNHYWTGSGQTTDWHHLHWGMRKGVFIGGSPATYVRGYAPKSEFTIDPVTGAWTHPDWIDPFVIVAANGDPALSSAAGVRHHPSGTLLESVNDGYWLVMNGQEIASVPNAVLASDRFDPAGAVRASDDEIGCYAPAAPLAAQGHMTLYQRPNSSTVVMAYDDTHVRYDVIRWEALLSWGYDASDLVTDHAAIQMREQTYAPMGFRLLRPGTLVKADEQTEVAIVTKQQTRLPIASGDVFEDLGFGWERVVSIPLAVLTDVAGPRENTVIDMDGIHACAVPPPCPNGGNCGGGDPEQGSEVCNGLDDDGNGQIDEIFLCRLGATDGPPCVSSCGTSGQRVCEAPTCSWGFCKPFAESCANGLDDDCNGLSDCDDPACSADPACQPNGGQAQIHLAYSGPSVPGLIILKAWWQPPNAAPRAWGTVPECVDTTSGDGQLVCTFGVPSGSSPMEFQVYLPDGRYWGDESCNPTGGCGATLGNLTVTGPNGLQTISMVPNEFGPPYYNGHIDMIP